MVDNSSGKQTATENKGRAKSRSKPGEKTVFVLDTNVLLHDPTSLFRFDEHDVFLPMVTLEELDNHKKGMDDVARNARTISRTMDALLVKGGQKLESGVPLNLLGNKEATGVLRFQTFSSGNLADQGLDAKKADNEILAVVKYLREKESPRSIVLVSKDINVRIKASALGFDAEDYFNDHVIQDSDLLYSGSQQLPADFWNRLKKSETWEDKNPDGHKVTLYRVKGAAVKSMLVNQFVYLNDFHAIVKQITADEAVLETLVRYDTAGKKAVFGISPNNREQNFALNLLLNPECDFVTMLGQAGTGKTLLALAAGLTQVFDKRLYDEIIVTRATVPIGDEIGFLPGSEEEKMAPWMGAIDDNLEVLSPSDDEGKAGDSGRKITDSFIRSRVKIKSMAFMRGRTFINKYVIVDEAQNLTPKQAKALITRAGPGTKMVFMGNIAQIDTPYLTEGSSGLTHVVDRMKGWCHSGHITLIRGERSRLADRASEVL